MFHKLPLQYQTALSEYASVLNYEPTPEGWVVPKSYRLEQFAKAGSPSKPQAPPRFVFHTTEVVNRSRDAVARMFHSHPTPPHLWMSNSGENSIAYPVSVSGSRKRRLSKLGSGRNANAPVSRTDNDIALRAYDGFDVMLQRVPFSRISWALRGTKASGIETNHMGYCGQVEIEGYAGDASFWSDTSLMKAAVPLVQFALWLRIHKGYAGWSPVAYESIGREAGTYGRKGVARMSKEEWRNGRRKDSSVWNVCTHQNVVGNTHWDCGRLNLGRICEHAVVMLDAMDGGAGVPASVPVSPAGYAEKVASVDVSGSWSGDVEAVFDGQVLSLSGNLKSRV